MAFRGGKGANIRRKREERRPNLEASRTEGRRETERGGKGGRH